MITNINCVAVLTILIAAEACNAQNFTRTRILRQNESEKQQYPRAYAFLQIPSPIEVETLNTWERLLHLSEGQSKAFRSFHEQYLTAFAEKRSKDLPDILNASTRTSPPTRLSHEEMGTQFAELQIDCHRLTEAILAIERRYLFDPMFPLLAEKQLLAMTLVTEHRLRQVYAVNMMAQRTTRIDLVEVMDYFLRQELLDIKDQSQFDILRAEYSRRATAIRKKLYDLGQDYIANGGYSMSNSRRAAIRDPQSTDPLRRIIRRTADGERDHVRLNDTYVERLAQLMTRSSAERLIKAYRQAAYPDVFPNPYDVTALMTIAVKTDGLTSEQRDDLMAVWSESRQRQEAVCKRMSDASVEWTHGYAGSGRFRDDEKRAAYEDNIDELNDRRILISRQAIDLAGGILADVASDAFDAAVLSFFEHIEGLETTTRRTGIYNPAKRATPMDDAEKQQSWQAETNLRKAKEAADARDGEGNAGEYRSPACVQYAV